MGLGIGYENGSEAHFMSSSSRFFLSIEDCYISIWSLWRQFWRDCPDSNKTYAKKLCRLTHCGVVTPSGDIDLGQHWFRPIGTMPFPGTISTYHQKWTLALGWGKLIVKFLYITQYVVFKNMLKHCLFSQEPMHWSPHVPVSSCHRNNWAWRK